MTSLRKKNIGVLFQVDDIEHCVYSLINDKCCVFMLCVPGELWDHFLSDLSDVTCTHHNYSMQYAPQLNTLAESDSSL